jgi:hypothetical protein
VLILHTIIRNKVYINRVTNKPRKSRKVRIRNATIRQQIGLEETVIKEIEQNQLTLYSHVQRMAE